MPRDRLFSGASRSERTLLLPREASLPGTFHRPRSWLDSSSEADRHTAISFRIKREIVELPIARTTARSESQGGAAESGEPGTGGAAADCVADGLGEFYGCLASPSRSAWVSKATNGGTRPRPTPPTLIFRGVTYTCFEAKGPECRGLVHVVKVDLRRRKSGLYLTPLDPDAVARDGNIGGFRYVGSAARKARGGDQRGIFRSDSGVLQWSGDLARSGETIVSDGIVSHVDPNSYLLWFESDLRPIWNPKSRRPSPLYVGPFGESAAKVFPCGNESFREGRQVMNGSPNGNRHHFCEKLLWLAIFENASSTGVARILAEQGESGWISRRWRTFNNDGAQH